jgi:hypothetical protein
MGQNAPPPPAPHSPAPHGPSESHRGGRLHRRAGGSGGGRPDVTSASLVWHPAPHQPSRARPAGSGCTPQQRRARPTCRRRLWDIESRAPAAPPPARLPVGPAPRRRRRRPGPGPLRLRVLRPIPLGLPPALALPLAAAGARARPTPSQRHRDVCPYDDGMREMHGPARARGRAAGFPTRSQHQRVSSDSAPVSETRLADSESAPESESADSAPRRPVHGGPAGPVGAEGKGFVACKLRTAHGSEARSKLRRRRPTLGWPPSPTLEAERGVGGA